MKKTQVSRRGKELHSAQASKKSRRLLWSVVSVLLLCMGGSAGTISYGWWRSKTTALVRGDPSLIKSLSYWLQEGTGRFRTFTSEEELPWYLQGERRVHSFITFQELNGWTHGPLEGASLIVSSPSQETHFFFFDVYGLFVPAEVANRYHSLSQLLLQENRPLLIAGADDGILFAFLSCLFAERAPPHSISLPALLRQAIAENKPSLVGFDSDLMMHLDEKAPFFSQGGGKELLSFLRACQKRGLLVPQWQFYTHEDVRNDFQRYESPLLFGLYEYKKGPFMRELAFYRMDLSLYEKGLIPVRLYMAGLNSRDAKKNQEARFFTRLTSPAALHVFNEKTPFLTLGLGGPFLNQEHRAFLDIIAQASLFPLGSEKERKENILLLRWLEAFRNLLRN
ncbi:MAG: hypothetical protein N2Z76_06210 [Treponemataceae bacterium]|nr:hypothetical protein [Treponemataceae bacterium]